MEYQISSCPKDLKFILTEWDLTKLREDDAHSIAGICVRNGALVSIRINGSDKDMILTCSLEPVCRQSTDD